MGLLKEVSVDKCCMHGCAINLQSLPSTFLSLLKLVTCMCYVFTARDTHAYKGSNGVINPVALRTST